ncbi:dienelactone hydrolase family protein [Candidatus Poriferisodalis sp.]|uniref:dienelactone hydrolase family protein n=1 Tax=Candidatus Poriferisodalis sp. TaxID=3101277 RepID=UPI003C6F7812
MPQQSYSTTVTEIDLTTADGTMNCQVITPERDGTLRAVIVYMPASGIRSELVGIAERIASAGHVVVLPNSFYRLARHVDIDARTVGGVGYCMGGRLAMASAGAYPDRFAAAASLYGAGIVTDEYDSPHLRLGEVAGELYFGLAENDIYVSEEETAALKAHLPSIDVRHAVETYPGTEHGFVFPERYCFSPEGAELHYQRLADLFARTLG